MGGSFTEDFNRCRAVFLILGGARGQLSLTTSVLVRVDGLLAGLTVKKALDHVTIAARSGWSPSSELMVDPPTAVEGPLMYKGS